MKKPTITRRSQATPTKGRATDDSLKLHSPVLVTVVYRMGAADYKGSVNRLTKTTIEVEYFNGVDTVQSKVNRATRRSKNGTVMVRSAQ
jgi:hypothetical protein